MKSNLKETKLSQVRTESISPKGLKRHNKRLDYFHSPQLTFSGFSHTIKKIQKRFNLRINFYVLLIEMKPKGKPIIKISLFKIIKANWESQMYLFKEIVFAFV